MYHEVSDLLHLSFLYLDSDWSFLPRRKDLG